MLISGVMKTFLTVLTAAFLTIFICHIGKSYWLSPNQYQRVTVEPVREVNGVQSCNRSAALTPAQVPGISQSLGSRGSAGTIYYVDGERGNDSNTGTAYLPFKTIVKVNQKVAAGDSVYVKNGTYQENITVTQSGTPDKWIAFQAFPGHKPFVIGTQDGTFRIEGNYIEINGFDVTSILTGSAIHVGKGNHHTRIINNELHDAGCGGVSGQETDYLHVEGNRVYRNAFRSHYQCSGISIYQAIAFDSEPGFHNIIRGNISYYNQNIVPREDGKITDGNGIIIDDFRQTQSQTPRPKYTASTLIENNIVFSNGGRGIHIFLSDNVTVRNNTSFHNSNFENLDGNLKGELSAYLSSNIQFYNNIACASAPDKLDFIEGESTNNKWEYNLACGGNLRGSDRSPNLRQAKNLIGVNPLFVNPSLNAAVANFRILPTSPAIDAGTPISAARTDFEGNSRPSGAGIDIGAHEFNLSHLKLR
ncbi:MAG: right-handed parallel beta-helix repeat-containing protein [Oscillatoria sp. Prado101]|nr:right-handed parallel beta-helix repeat-containing protein [Oscillatoria sp. Prado101]